MTAIATYRKCQICGAQSTDMRKTKCKCGGHMYLYSSYYAPKTRRQKNEKV